MTIEPAYWVVADDGKEYGPIPESELLSWIQDGRIRGHNQVLLEGSTEWQTADIHPQFRHLFAPPTLTARPKRQGARIVAWVAGLAVVSALTGMILLATKRV